MRLLLAALAASGGLYGTVTRGPIMPVCAIDKPCDAPAPGVLLIFRRNGRDVARVRSGGGGAYRIRLAAGLYSVRLPSTPKIGRGLEPRSVHVPRGSAARVDFSIDTGIR